MSELDKKVAHAMGLKSVNNCEQWGETQEPPKYSFKAHWEKDGRIGLVAAIVRSDGGVHILEDVIDMPQRTEQEPVAWFRYQQGSRVYYDSKKWDDCQPLYTHPPQRKPLNWEPIQEFWRNNPNIDWDELESAIKQALKEKNT
jgi:hypothetical protein